MLTWFVHAGLYPDIAESFFQLLKRERITTDRSGEDLLDEWRASESRLDVQAEVSPGLEIM
ncbi:hypothetical protein BK659_12370 [Pseudomonas brassicacearum]|uniref:Uncharacterized protein n=1 Tax=Pseudomonas brassicacearum TaxID=930166 RepID=A0A423H766_9PSED|nr:hypothetical protein BK659_12370 [Pseudomonas brassicacearum]